MGDKKTQTKIKSGRGVKPSGPDDEYSLYIPEDRYKFIDIIYHDELKVLRKKST